MTTTPDITAEGNRQQAIEEALKICANEAIHLIGSIQPAGVLLAVDRKTFLIRASSQNLDSIFPLGASTAIGRHVGELIGEESLAWLKTLVNLGPWPGAKVGSITLTRDGEPVKFDAQLFFSGDLFVLEVEQGRLPAGDVFHDLFIPIRDALWKLDAEANLERYAHLAVDQVRVLTGFDRVMMYRFDTNWDGEVIAESKTEDSDSYLGNRFPASDIPPQARDLYTRNLVRVIADVDAEPVPLVTTDGQMAGQQVDLSHSWLRSMSPVHLEYLRNMGVKASLSISLVQNDRLWGLIACHHFTPRYVGLRSRELDEFIGRVVSLKLINMDNQERDALGRRIRDLLYELTELIRSSDDLDSVIVLLKDQLLGLVRASGAVVTIDGKSHLLGETPAAPILDRLLDALRKLPAAPVFHTDDLGQLIDEAAHDDRELSEAVRGLMVAPLDHRMNNFVMWFRPGILRTLRWAGDPRKTLIQDESGLRISPRTSFDTWIQTYHDKSTPWSHVEVDAANSLSLALIEVLAQKALKSSEESYRLLAENSTDMIARLELDGHFRFASPACRDLFGLSGDQLAGLTLAEVMDEPAEILPNLLLSLQALGTTMTRVLRGKRSDGGDLWIEATLKHTVGAHGEEEILMNARDVTQRYNYQLAIEDVHRRHTRILEAAGEGLVSLDENGNVVYANEVAARLLRHEEEELVGKFCCHVFCWREDETCAAHGGQPCPFIQTLKDGETRQGTQHLIGSEGHPPQAVQYVCTPLLDHRRVAGCVVVFSEVSVQAADQNVPTDAILDAAAEAVMVTGPSGRIISVNRAFTEITGYSADEAIGQSPRLLRSGVHTPHFYEDLWRLLEEKRRWSGEIWNRRKNGEIYPQWGSISAILEPDGSVKNYVAVFSDISKAKQAEEKLFHLANHDTLTSLPNRMNFTENLTLTLERCRRQNYGAAVVFIDLDRFKIINDTLGHAIGDKYLRQVSERLLSTIRKQDLLARWGGDEFVLVMEATNNPQAIGEALSRTLDQLAEPIYLSGHELIPTASIGVALYPEDGRRAADLIKAADTAMYGAKQRGGNCYEFYSSEMAKDLSTKLTMISELRHALLEHQFFLVYQPQVDPRSGALKGVEALARWQHPLRGELAPAEFLPMVEEMGMIGDLGRWALNEACRQLRDWTTRAVPVPKMSVNVAPSQLRESFVAEVAEIIRKWGIDPGKLELEITEGALESGEVARKITSELRALGVLLAVDDFGTGYSSLSHIKLFPITCFKIDKSFVNGVPGNPADVAIVRTILALGSSFNVEIIAEGVETAEQMEFLKGEGVTNIQGFHFAHPMSAAGVEEWLP